MLPIQIVANQLVNTLRSTGFKGYKLPEITKECVDSWSDDYAIFHNAYLDYEFYDEYFDVERLKYDFREYVKTFFASDPSVIVHFHMDDTEIEFYRKKQ